MANEVGVAPRYVDWPAAFAGGLAAAAILFVLLTAGGAVGLSLVSPYPYHSHARVAASLAAFWVIASSIGSLLAGGYIAGRMRTAWHESISTEIAFRDGVHGLLVWALSIAAGVFLGLLAAATAATTGAEFGRVAFSAPENTSVLASPVDQLLRTTAPTPSPAGPTAAAAPGVPQPEARPEVTRALANAVASGQLSDPDRKYLADIVAQRSGLSPTDSEKRVNEVYASAVKDVDAARKASVAAGLVTATALLVGLLAAWYAAQRGGYQRDHNIPARFGTPRAMPKISPNPRA
jgi:hypothetical protein